MEQAGVNSIQLIENKELLLLFNSDATIAQIATGGTILNITSEYQKNFTIKEIRGRNGKINYTYEVDFLNLNQSDVTTIKRSIYGWLAVLTFNSKDSKIITIPLKFANSIQNNNTSASYSTKITNFDLTNKKMVSFNPIPLPWILETGYWNDSNYWLDNENWID